MSFDIRKYNATVPLLFHATNGHC